MTTTVRIIDDDESVRRAFLMLLESADFKAQTYSSAEAFLIDENAASGDCIVTDIGMTDLSGLDLMERMRLQGLNIPVIVVSACDDDYAWQRAFKLGAKAFFCKPVDDQALLDAIHWAIEGD